VAETDRRVPGPSFFLVSELLGRGRANVSGPPKFFTAIVDAPQVRPDAVETEARGPPPLRRRVKLEISESLVRIIGKLSDILQKDLTSSCRWRCPGPQNFTPYAVSAKNFLKQLPRHRGRIALAKPGKEVTNAAFLLIIIKR
jgi:hypothetical protein